MLERRTDFDQDEEEFLRSFGTSPEEVRARAAACPTPDALLAAQSDEVVGHLRTCKRCSALLRDLSDPDLADPQPDEAARIRDRVFGGIGARDARWRLRPVFALAAGLSLAFIGALLWFSSSNVIAPSPAPVNVQSRPTVFKVEKAPVKLLPSILVWRGEGDGYAAALGRAITLYRNDQYAEATQELAAVTKTYPQSLEAHFYLGISQLLLGRAADARANLARARELDRGSLSDEIAWYLALANVKTGNTTEAMIELRKLCERAGDYSTRACAGIQEIEPNRE